MKLLVCLLAVTLLPLPLLTCSDDSGSQPNVEPGWVPLGDGIGAGIEGYVVSALAVHEGNLIASGHEIKPGEQTFPCEVWQWNGPIWERLGAQFNHRIFDLVVWNGSLIAVGEFTAVGQRAADRIAVWNNGQWEPFSEGTDGLILAAVVWRGDLLIGGSFTTAGNAAVENIAVWKDGAWQPVENQPAARIHTLTIHEDQLFAGGSTQGPSGSEAWVGRFNGASWDSLGDIHGGMGSIAFSSVHAATYYDDQLVVAGHFRFADETRVNGIALRSEEVWEPLGTGLGLGYPYGGGSVLGTYNGDLVVGGDFVMAGDEVVNNIARWDGSAWKGFGQGVEWAAYDAVTWNGRLVVGGVFATAGADSAANIALWRE